MNVPNKNSSGNITVFIAIAITVLIGLMAGTILYLRKPIVVPTPKKAVENFYAEPAGIDTRLP